MSIQSRRISFLKRLFEKSLELFYATFAVIFTVCIQISAQPRISAHLEQALILKGEKVNKRSASNKCPPLLLPIKLK